MLKFRCGNICTVFEQNYNCSYEKITRLVNEAKKDYPDLKDADIRIVVYSGERYRRMVAVEFVHANGGLIKDDYVYVNDLEYTYN